MRAFMIYLLSSIITLSLASCAPLKVGALKSASPGALPGAVPLQPTAPVLPPSPTPAQPQATVIPLRPAQPGEKTVVTASVEPFILCSPLDAHPLSELPEIISDPYHPPPPGHEERHQGVDFSYYRHGEHDSIRGVGVQSVLEGRVAASLADKFPYGNTVIIETSADHLPSDLADRIGLVEGESLYVLYAHMQDAPLVDLNAQISACQPLGKVGMSGNAGVPHLHVETRLGPAATQFASMLFYSTRATQEEMDNYRLWRTSGTFRHFDPMLLLSYMPGS